MLALARAYVGDNELLLVDEPSKGLAPIVVEKVMQAIEQMKEKTTVLLVEQNFFMASTIGDRFYIVDEGRIVHHGQMKELKEDQDTRKKYLGIA
jgi:branched-chain amino acid transport system ATP-binding protein